MLLAFTNLFVFITSLKTMANPVMLSYRFMTDSLSYREAADPSIIMFKGVYYIFASKCGGYYHSTDLLHWTLIPAQPPLLSVIEAWAPTVIVLKDAIYFLTSFDRRLFKSTNPLGNEWTIVTSNFGVSLQDPDLFVDDDDRVYYYGGCSNSKPIIGVEINLTTWQPIGQQLELIHDHADTHGWERAGDYNDGNDPPWIEGAFMQKHGGKYYLEYASPATPCKSYNDAIYVSDHPLGPFTIAKHNPMSYLPEGFLSAAGHSSSLIDNYGNWWHIASAAISVRHAYERRLGLFPMFFDADGEVYCYTGFGDWPIVIPDKKILSPDELKTGWILLSRKKSVKASSSQAAHPATYAVNENIRQWWAATTGHAGEFLEIDLGRESTINAIQVNFADEGSTQLGRVAGIYYQYIIQISTDGTTWNTIVDKSKNTEDLVHDYIQLDEAAIGRHIKITSVRVPEPMVFSLSGFRIFGKQNIASPVASSLSASRLTDTRSASLSWSASATAVGYNIRFGIDPKKLYQNYIAYDRTTLQINSLLAGSEYWFTIDAFNEGGITIGTIVVSSHGVHAPTNTPSAPVINRLSSPSWGSFPSTGPRTDQTIQYSLSDGNAGKTYTVYWRFDVESFRTGNSVVTVGTNTYTFPATAFTGSRLTPGSHSASIQVHDNTGGLSNIITVSYTVASAGSLIISKRLCFGGLAVLAAFSGMASIYYKKWTRKTGECDIIAMA